MNLRKLTFTRPQTHQRLTEDFGENVVAKARFSYVTPSSIVESGLADILYKNKFLMSIGIDPGKYFGMASVYLNTAADIWDIRVLNGTLYENKNINKPLRDSSYSVGKSIINFDAVVVEGASYGDRFGQVKLAEIRAGFMLGVSSNGIKVITAPPKSPRKSVFGDGNLGAWEVWPTLNHNAADALCLALYPYFKEVL